ncbi:hypothetical protein [Actinomadura parmotrematis]|uniref:DUF3995 domain-containing protein n=1 Tax=Actinomadura parmotrematis TaxID=2864039 RepID=A0ABS7FWU3_9ACTN|nr:hypothetical protein [Actinomadura parmotrematis]MBW8484895.1 hypothetical protein [Actinomadura parmotrematis]
MQTYDDRARTARRAAYTAFAWVMLFLAWHVVWVRTGLKTPSPADHDGASRVAMQVGGVVLIGMVAVGILLPLALAQQWGRHIPHRLLLATAWTGCALLGLRGLSGVADDLARATGLLPRGFTDMTMAQVTGTPHPSLWAVTASVSTDVLFTAGALAFAWAAATHPGSRVPRSPRGSRPRTRPGAAESSRGRWTSGLR